MRRLLTDFNIRTLLSLLAVFIASAQARAEDGAVTSEVVLSITPGGVEYAMWGGADGEATPTLIIMPGQGIDKLSEPGVLKAGVQLVPLGYRCVGIDLPDHGRQAGPGTTGIKQWAQRCIDGDDFVAEFNDRMKQVVDHLIDQSLTDPDKIVVSGTSRGGFLALHYAAFDPRVDATVAYAPAIDLAKVHKYFDVAQGAPMLEQLNLMHQAPKLVGRPVLLFVGDRDDGVDTESVIGFARALSAQAVKADVPSQVELHVVSEPRGHALSSALVRYPAARWVYRILEGRELSDL